MATDWLYPNGNDGGWDVSNHANCNEGINGPGLDDDSDGPVDSTHVDETTEGAVLNLDLEATGIVDADTVTAVDIRIRARNNGGGGNDEVGVDFIVGGTAQGTQFSTNTLGSSFATYNASGATQGWNSDWTAAQLNGAQVRLTAGQSGMPVATAIEVAEVEVEITYTPATVSIPESAYLEQKVIMRRTRTW